MVGGLGLGVGLASLRFPCAGVYVRGLPSRVQWVGPGLGVGLCCWPVTPLWVSIINAVMIRIAVFCGTVSRGTYPKDCTDSLSHSIPIWRFQEVHVIP